MRGGVGTAGSPSVFYLFRDSPMRRASLASRPGSAERYCLFGADQLAQRGLAVRHSLEPGREPRARHVAADVALRRAVWAVGGYGGDFRTVLACRDAANASDVVVSTVDTVGLPLALLVRAGIACAPFVYTSVGLLDRIARLRNDRMRRLYERSVGQAGAVVAYSSAEAEALRGWLAHVPSPPAVSFVPFGVDTAYFAPLEREADFDVVSLGADPQRDYALLARVANTLPQRRFRAVVTPGQARDLSDRPGNLTVEPGVDFASVRGVLAGARVVALPVRDNLYSGATTTLLQAMAMGRPVVVSRTAAVAQGYGLVDGENCRLVPPGADEAFGRALRELLDEPETAAALGRRAREHVVEELGWDRYVAAIEAVVREVAAARRQPTA